MKFKAKLRKIGNSQGILVPLKVITDFELGEEIELDVITPPTDNQEKPKDVITPPKIDKQVITPKANKKLVFNSEKGFNEWK